MININKSAITYNGRDVATKEDLIKSTQEHIRDVAAGLKFLAEKLEVAEENHDYDKLENIDDFYTDFLSGFDKTKWWDNHAAISRHHINICGKPFEDVNLLDVLEFITDCVMAGMARNGKVYKVELPYDILTKAFSNTVQLMIDNVKVVE